MDGGPDGNQLVTITAEAAGHTAGSDLLVVTDNLWPDLQVTPITVPPVVEAGTNFPMQFAVKNAGFGETTNGFQQAIYLSRDGQVGDDLAVGAVNVRSRLRQDAQTPNALSVPAPLEEGEYWVVVVADATNGVREVVEHNNVAIAGPILVANA